MGLAERITQAQAEATTIKLAAALEAQRKLQEEKDLELQLKTMAAQQEEARKASLIVELSPFLDVVGARDQLEQVRKVWGVGTVDSQPELLEANPELSRIRIYSSFTLGLGLRHRFTALKEEIGSCGYEGEDSYHKASVLYERDAAVIVAVTKEPAVWLLYGLKDISVVGRYTSKEQRKDEERNVRAGASAGYYIPSVEPGYRIISETYPISFSKDDSIQARKTLEDQFVQFIPRIESPVILATRARSQISQDKYINHPLFPWLTKLFS